jgi:uncharacterized protein YneF (UPF0154 family)
MTAMFLLLALVVGFALGVLASVVWITASTDRALKDRPPYAHED